MITFGLNEQVVLRQRGNDNYNRNHPCEGMECDTVNKHLKFRYKWSTVWVGEMKVQGKLGHVDNMCYAAEFGLLSFEQC